MAQTFKAGHLQLQRAVVRKNSITNVSLPKASSGDRGGLPHTEQLHIIERFTRLDSKTLRYEATIDDPGAYRAAWSGGFLLGWDLGQELFEYVCYYNNLAHDLMVGEQEFIDRHKTIVP